MTVRELIEELQKLPDEDKDLEVCYYDEYRYVGVCPSFRIIESKDLSYYDEIKNVRALCIG